MKLTLTCAARCCCTNRIVATHCTRTLHSRVGIVMVRVRIDLVVWQAIHASVLVVALLPPSVDGIPSHVTYVRLDLVQVVDWLANHDKRPSDPFDPAAADVVVLAIVPLSHVRSPTYDPSKW